MIEISETSLAGIACLHATPAGMQHKALPVVAFWHGFTSSKEVYAYFAVALAQRGFRVVMPDALHHGTRYNGDSETRLTQFWEILRSNIDEVACIRQALEKQGLIADGRFAVGGASQGGMTALGAMARYPDIRSVACLMGSGYFSTLAKQLFPPFVAHSAEAQAHLDTRLAPLAEWDVTHHLAALAERPLLIWHGDADEVVPVAESVRLVDALRAQGYDQHLTTLIETHVGHRVTPAALQATAAFFASSL